MAHTHCDCVERVTRERDEATKRFCDDTEAMAAERDAALRSSADARRWALAEQSKSDAARQRAESAEAREKVLREALRALRRANPGDPVEWGRAEAMVAAALGKEPSRG